MPFLTQGKTNWKYIIIVLVLAVIIGGGILGWIKTQESAPAELLEIKKPEKVEDETANWKSYRNEEYGFEIKYPDDLLTLSEKEKKIILTHSIPYEHPDPCDFKGNAPSLKKLTDFEVSVEVINKSLRETVIANESDYLVSKFLLDNKLKISPGFIDEFSIGSLKGYRISKGVEGCGTYTYYFPLDSKNTLLIRRSWVAEFNPINADYKKYLKLPGIIPPDKEENLFNQILSTFRFLK